MDGENYNDPDLLNVDVELFKFRILSRFFRLDRLIARLLNLIYGLRPNQLNDPMRPELILLREMENDEVYIANAYAGACIFLLNREELPRQDRRDLVQRFRTVIDLIDNLLAISSIEIVRLQQQP